VATLDFQAGAGSLSGRVTLAGKPKSDESISVTNVDGLGGISLRTDNDGRYQVGGLVPGSYRLRAGNTFPPREVGTVRIAGAEERTLDLELAAGTAAIKGRVVGWRDQEPLDGAAVMLYRHTPETFAAFPVRVPRMDWLPPVNKPVATSPVGEFQFRELQPGTYFFTVAAPEGGRARGWHGPFEIGANRSIENLTLELGGPGALTVEVISADQPLAGASASLESEDDWPVWIGATTDANGLARFEEIRLGRYRLRLMTNGFLPVAQLVDVSGSGVPASVTVSLERASWLLVKLAGGAQSDAHLSILAACLSGGDPLWPQTARKGGYHAAMGGGNELRIPTHPGTYRVRFEISRTGPRSEVLLEEEREVTVSDGGETVVELGVPGR